MELRPMSEHEGTERMVLTRRGFLAGLAALGVAACSGDDGGEAAPTTTAPTSSTTTEPSIPVPELVDDPFTLGVASGDPLPEAVILWTRLAPDPMAGDGGMPAEDAPVRWVLAADEDLTDVVAEGTATAEPRWAHSVHVDATGLEPATTYWYRFEVGDWQSPVGRTRTAPATDASPDQVRLVVANCHAYQSGFYSAYQHLSQEDDVDALLFLGDYMYELESSLDARQHGLEVPVTVEEFRVFYAVNKTDEDLQTAHHAFPWIVTWDDHEVEDNYADDLPGVIGEQAATEIEGGFPAKRAAAYQAWWEHMPVRVGPPDEGDLRIYRDFEFGDLVRMPVIDTRQYRTEQPKGEGAGALPRSFGGGPQLEGAFDPDATMLGEEQEAWLFEVLGASTATWNVLAQQSVMAEVDRAPDDPDAGFSMDSWDGYVVPRQRILDHIDQNGVENFVSVGGDIHTSAVTDLHLDPTDLETPVIGSELIGPSISALELLQPEFVEGARSNPHIHLYEPSNLEGHGYLVLTFDPERTKAEFKYVSTILEPESELQTGTTWEVQAGQPGAREV